MKKTIRCIIAGYGYMGEIRRRVIEANPDLKLIAIVDPDEKKRVKTSGVPAVASIGSLPDRDYDLIFVCTPNCYAPDIIIRSLKAGKHVFCEKPPGRSLEDIQNIMDHETKGLKLMFGFNHRYHPGIMKAKVIVDGGTMGQIVGLRGIYGKSGGADFRNSWRNDKEISGGGILLDQGIHMLDLFLYFCGDFDQVKAFTSNRYWQFEVEDNACVILKNKSGQMAMLHSSATFWKHQFQMDIILEKGYLIIKGLLSKSGSYGRETLIVGRQQFEEDPRAMGNPSEEIVYFDSDDSWETEVGEIVRCIKENRPVVNSSSRDAYNIMRVIDAAYRDNEGAAIPTLKEVA